MTAESGRSSLAVLGNPRKEHCPWSRSSSEDTCPLGVSRLPPLPAAAARAAECPPLPYPHTPTEPHPLRSAHPVRQPAAATWPMPGSTPSRQLARAPQPLPSSQLPFSQAFRLVSGASSWWLCPAPCHRDPLLSSLPLSAPVFVSLSPGLPALLTECAPLPVSPSVFISCLPTPPPKLLVNFSPSSHAPFPWRFGKRGSLATSWAQE